MKALLNPKVGAVTFNFIHRGTLAIVLHFPGRLIQLPGLQLAGLVMFRNSRLDRALGFGLQESTPKGT